MTATAPARVADKFSAANKRSAFICLIETADGVKNIDGIAALEGVDCLWVGHFDLSVSLGIPGDFAHPTFLAAMDKIIAAAKKHNKSLGRLVPNVQQGIDYYAQGFDFICYSGDVWVFHDAMADAVVEDPRRLQLGAAQDHGQTTPSASRSRVTSARPDGSPTYPDFDLEPLRTAPGVEMEFLEAEQPAARRAARGFRRADPARPPLRRRRACRRAAGSPSWRASASATTRSTSKACTDAGIALVITPDGVRRPVAVSVITLMLALTGKLHDQGRADPRRAGRALPSAPTTWASASSGARWARSASAISAPKCSAWQSPST